jgi:diguanylate cyclase (GGDEF)-like protein
VQPLQLDISAFYVQEIGALLFGMVFVFLWRQSRVVYFGLWSAAWLLRFIAAIFGFEFQRTLASGWLAPYATFEFAFVVVLTAAARAGFASDTRDWRTVLRLIAVLPVFVTIVYAVGMWGGLEAYHTSHALVLAFVYFYNFVTLRRHHGLGRRIFRFSLLMLAVVFLEHGFLLVYLYKTGAAPVWVRYMQQETYYDFILHCVLAFAAMAMWSESQMDRVRELGSEVNNLRRDIKNTIDLDRLTGLLNQTALARRVEDGTSFEGVVAVCDMDNFKDINDRFGHLVGDEILRHIGNLLQTSIRHDDLAFRWGGDEFVLLFQNQREEVARKRMADLEARLQEFRVRGLGVLPISFSWGTAETYDRPLRDALDEADRNMYALKRTRPGTSREHQV